jgi:dedicator of cytokinesis protein 3
MRRECVTRLVSGNLVQGLDVIVRHPTWGGLVSVDVEGDIDFRSWVSAIRMYAMQTSLAYLDVSLDGVRPYTLSPSVDYVQTGPLPTPAHSAFPDLSYSHHSRPRSQGYVAPTPPLKSPPAKFYHVFLDLRAFVASPCSPGETAELFFSLYKKQGTQFVTEEFCAILNHNGVLARNPSGRIRTLFTELAPSDIVDPIYLVCRIVRNGALKIGSNMSSGVPDGSRRGSEASSRTDNGNFGGSSEISNGLLATSPPGTRGNVSNDSSTQFRRPFGCAVLELTQLSKIATEQSDVLPMREYTMPIFIPTNEVSFSMIHQNIINNNAKEFDKSVRYVIILCS